MVEWAIKVDHLTQLKLSRHILVRGGHVETVVAEFGANVNAKAKGGWTPLHLLTQDGHTDSVRLLASEFGANVNATVNNGWTLLHVVAARGHLNLLELLVADSG